MLGQGGPENPGLGPDFQFLLIDGYDAAHPRHVEQHAAVGHRLALGGQSAAEPRPRYSMVLGGFQQQGYLSGAAGDDPPVRHAMGGAAGVGGKNAARRGFLEQFDALCSERVAEPRPALACPATSVGLLAPDADQRIGRDEVWPDHVGATLPQDPPAVASACGAGSARAPGAISASTGSAARALRML